MQIIFNIDDGLLARIKKTFTRKRAALALTIFVILASALLFAATKPHTFTPGATISSSQVNENFDAAFTAVAKAVPPGTVMAYAGTTVPDGYLLCDGSSVSRATYSKLFESIGATYGSGDGSTTFNLPDYRGVFLRGHHHGSTKDPDSVTRTIGSEQSYQFENHVHKPLPITYYPVINLQVSTTSTGWCALLHVPGQGFSEITTSDPLNGNHGSETRPVNRSVTFIIKY
jgi:microcystin-dependent protein